MEKEIKIRKGFIYKITSPNNKVYIGQTLNLNKRKLHYNSSDFSQQVKLWNNCKKYNWNPLETFEIIEECLCGENKIVVNERERFWINFYDSFNNGLNCNEGGHGNLGYKHSKESRKKMRDSHLGVKHSEERNKRKSERQKGKTRSLETKKKISETKIKNMNEITKNKIRIKLFGNKNGIGNKGAAKKIICTTTKEIFQSVKEAAIKLELHSSNIIKVCKNKQSHTGGFKFKYYE